MCCVFYKQALKQFSTGTIMNKDKAKETLRRWWHYRGLARESLDSKPSIARAYIGLIALFILVVIATYVTISATLSMPQATIPQEKDWLSILGEAFVVFVMLTIYGGGFLVLYALLWVWVKKMNSRHPISWGIYILAFPLGLLLQWSILRTYGYFDVKADLIVLLPALFLAPVLIGWIQGWRQALIFTSALFGIVLFGWIFPDGRRHLPPALPQVIQDSISLELILGVTCFPIAVLLFAAIVEFLIKEWREL